MRELRAIIFDVDGTLADTEVFGHRIAFNEAFKDAGLSWEWNEKLYGELLKVGGGKERLRHYIDRYVRAPIDKYDRAFIDRLHINKMKHYERLIDQGEIPLRPGIDSLLEDARASNITLAVASTSSAQSVHALLDAHFGGKRVPELFKVIGAGDVVPNKKPSPDIYRWVLGRLSMEAHDCIAIEDSHIGLMAAIGARLKTIVTPNAYTCDEDFTLATRVVPATGSEQSAGTTNNAGSTPALTMNLVHEIFNARQA